MSNTLQVPKPKTDKVSPVPGMLRTEIRDGGRGELESAAKGLPSGLWRYFQNGNIRILKSVRFRTCFRPGLKPVAQSRGSPVKV